MEDDKKRVKIDLIRQMDDTFSDLLRDNATSTTGLVKKTIEREFGLAKTDMESFCQRRMPLQDTSLFEKQHTTLLQAAMTVPLCSLSLPIFLCFIISLQ
jgi:hypothetical protein